MLDQIRSLAVLVEEFRSDFNPTPDTLALYKAVRPVLRTPNTNMGSKTAHTHMGFRDGSHTPGLEDGSHTHELHIQP